MMHEFGHVAGLADLYLYAGDYSGYLMEFYRPQAMIPRKDILYLRENYRTYEHGSSPH